MTALDTIAILALITSIIFPLHAGIIWSVAIGFAFGSYATSIISRVPKGLLLRKKNPYCMSCNKYLEPRDLYPILSYIICKGRCRFCHAKIPPAIFLTETLTILSFVGSYLYFKFSWEYIISAITLSLAFTLIILAMNNKAR